MNPSKASDPRFWRKWQASGAVGKFFKLVTETDAFNSLIVDTIEEMKTLAKKGRFIAKQELNGVTVLVEGDSGVALVFRDHQRAQSGYIDGPVGPHPKPELSTEDVASDTRISDANEARWAKEAAARKVIHDQKEREFFAELGVCPAMDRDEAKWKQGIDAQKGEGYGLACYTYAEYWARLMQKQMDEGYKLEAIADECSHKADIPVGITGFMYGCAVSILAQCWKHGDTLRRWHNKETQLGDEGDKANESGGVLNPALLSIG